MTTKRIRKPVGKPKSLKDQIKTHAKKPVEKKEPLQGNMEIMISTGSTLLDLAISGGRIRGGGIPAGILVEIFGPSGSGKTVLLSEIAGAVQRKGGQVMFRDPEARLNKLFAQLFDLDTDEIDYDTPNTVVEVFSKVRDWQPENPKKINGIFADSLAALTTDWEMEDKDQYGMRRAKEFSEQCRLTCRTITQKNYLMVCSNQIRVNVNAGEYGQKYKSPGGEAVGFYASLRLRTMNPVPIKRKEKVAGKELKKVVGVNINMEVAKNSVWEPNHIAPVTILFDYGIDDIRQNLQYIKDHTNNNVYTVDGSTLSKSMQESIEMVEEDELVDKLKTETIDLWEEIQEKFKSNRKKKQR